jgi:hypothetical protein
MRLTILEGNLMVDLGGLADSGGLAEPSFKGRAGFG